MDSLLSYSSRILTISKLILILLSHSWALSLLQQRASAFRYLHMLISLLLSRPNCLSSLSCSSWKMLQSLQLWPLVGLFPIFPCLSCSTWEPRNGNSPPGAAWQVLNREKGWPPATCWQCFEHSPRCHWTSFWQVRIYWLTVNLVPTRTTRSFSAKLLSSWAGWSDGWLRLSSRLSHMKGCILHTLQRSVQFHNKYFILLAAPDPDGLGKNGPSLLTHSQLCKVSSELFISHCLPAFKTYMQPKWLFMLMSQFQYVICTRYTEY